MPEQLPVVVVSTGRCGSTLLSTLLRDHPGVLSLSEFWPNRVNLPALFGRTPLTGQAYWNLLSEPMAGDIYQIALDGRISQVPKRSLCERNYMRRIALPMLVDDYDSLFDEIERYVVARGVATPAQHIEAMFAFIRDRLGKRVWVERTGASVEYLPAWCSMWPHMKVIHVFRDGRDVALSMSRHHAFRLMVMRKEADPDSSWLRIRPLPVERLDVAAFYAREIPLSTFGQMWTRMVRDGLEHLATIPTAQQHWIRYEDLRAEPERVLSALLTFIDPSLPSAPWTAQCASAMARPQSDWRSQPPAIRAALTDACGEGLSLLGYPTERA